MEIQPNQDDRLTLVLPQMKARCNVMLDGKDYPATGPEVPTGLTLAFTKTGDRSVDSVTKIKGKPTWKGSWTVSNDGQTLTITGATEGTNEQTKTVYDKQ